MTSPVAIAKRKQPAVRTSWSCSSASSSASSSYASAAQTPPSTNTLSKAKVVPPPTRQLERISPRRPSLLGHSLAQSEYTVVNLSHSDEGPQRLVSCVKSEQGFDWNQELFLPSYVDYEANNLEHKQDPVDEILLTDEEAAMVLPQ